MDIETVRKAMEATANLLGQIKVPVSLFDPVIVPIRNAINNMYIGLNALKEEPKEAEGSEPNA